MKYALKTITLLGLIIFLAACSGTGRFIEKPVLRVAEADITPAQAIDKLFTAETTPFQITICEANQETGDCPDADINPGATGIGGLFIPLAMEFRSIDVEGVKRGDGQLEITTSLNAFVNKIPVACGTVDGYIVASDDSAILKLPTHYCNWMVIGNVGNTVTLSIDKVNLTERYFTGFYKLSFYGTGNANGSGYYKAEIKQTDG